LDPGGGGDAAVWRVPRPRQSFECGAAIEGTNAGAGPDVVAEGATLLVVSRLAGVTRRDGAARLAAAAASGGGGAMAVERLMHGVAFKLGRAPKYGA
jgi:hypothetical protein